MSSCEKPHVDYPCRVPLKIFGRENVLAPEAVAELILRHLGPQLLADQIYTTKRKGAYLSFTFWVTLPNSDAERPLREAIQQLPGYVMQF